MNLPFKVPLLLIVALALPPESVAYCKWTDKNGTVHYVEECTNNNNTTRVEVEPPPNQEQIETSQRRSEQMWQINQARTSQHNREQQQQSAEQLATRNLSAAKLQQCAGARWQLGTLRERRPVYMDENGNFYSNQSQHNVWYQGPRQYLSDPQRAAEIQRFEHIEAETCNTSEAEIRNQVRSYVKQRNQEICRQLRVQLTNMQKSNSGVPSQNIRSLNEAVRTQCQ